MYTEIGDADGYMAMLASARWEDHGPHQVSQRLDIDWPGAEYAVLFRLPPGGHLYRHADEGYAIHIPLETNDEVVSLSFEDGVRTEHHLAVGKAYRTDRSIEHESFNAGLTNRTHLVVVLA